MNRFLLTQTNLRYKKRYTTENPYGHAKPKLFFKCFSSEGSSDILRKTDNKSCYYWKVILVIFYGTEYRRM